MEPAPIFSTELGEDFTPDEVEIINDAIVEAAEARFAWNRFSTLVGDEDHHPTFSEDSMNKYIHQSRNNSPSDDQGLDANGEGVCPSALYLIIH